MFRFGVFFLTVALVVAAGCAPAVNNTFPLDSGDDTALNNDLEAPSDELDDAGTTDVVEISSRSSVQVSSQKFGNQVTIDRVSLAASGYVVIHEDSNNVPDSVIGTSQLLSVGDNANVVVPLSRETKAGEYFWAMLHADNGDGVYVFPGADEPLRDESSEIIMMRFEVVE